MADIRTPETRASEVLAILAAQALRPAESLRPEDRVADLGIDSLGMAEVIFAIEERFGVSVPVGAERDPALDLTTVAGIIAAVERLVAEAQPA
jgi:acyl carrier protein